MDSGHWWPPVQSTLAAATPARCAPPCLKLAAGLYLLRSTDIFGNSTFTFNTTNDLTWWTGANGTNTEVSWGAGAPHGRIQGRQMLCGGRKSTAGRLGVGPRSWRTSLQYQSMPDEARTQHAMHSMPAQHAPESMAAPILSPLPDPARRSSLWTSPTTWTAPMLTPSS